MEREPQRSVRYLLPEGGHQQLLTSELGPRQRRATPDVSSQIVLSNHLGSRASGGSGAARGSGKRQSLRRREQASPRACFIFPRAVFRRKDFTVCTSVSMPRE